jgi:hypothetical protein
VYTYDFLYRETPKTKLVSVPRGQFTEPGDPQMTKSTQQPIRPGDKVIRDAATKNQSKVKLGEAAPIFRPIRAGDQVTRDAATQNPGKVKLGEAAPIFRPIRAGDKVMRDGATENQGKVKLGEAAPIFRPAK